MDTARKELIDLVKKISEEEVKEVLDFALYLKMKRKKNEIDDLLKASESSLDFWNNEIDDEVWDNV